MPHALTPLGKQLRSVLANLTPTRCWVNPPSNASSKAAYEGPRNSKPAEVGGRQYHASACNGGAVAASTAAKDVDAMYRAIDGEDEKAAAREHSRKIKRWKYRERNDYLTVGLKTADSRGVLPEKRLSKVDLSYVNPKTRFSREAFRANAKRHPPRRAETTISAYTKHKHLGRITASLIHHTNEVAQTGQAAWAAPFSLAEWEKRHLKAKGFTADDIDTWAAIVSMQDPLAATTALAERNAKSDAQPVPLFILLYVLRRPYLNAQALRVLMQQAVVTLGDQGAGLEGTPRPENEVFILFTRLLRHSREVWPHAMAAITDILLHALPTVYPSGTGLTAKQVESLSHMLNKAMHLLAVQTAVQPFKDNAYQEAAIVRVLRFMAEHQPSLQLNREGYRAVIEIQLAQKKTPSEQQWAELKALSWPPWKQERTAMDALITAEDHGVTRAGDTLRRMREAGYAPTHWERAAELYAGWDTDRTPTIQTREIIGTGSARFTSGAVIWAARIATTRTAQEAWAAYLAFEDAKLPPSQDVNLAIFRKLYEEDKRRRLAEHADAASKRGTHRAWRVLPGDRREVEPLPPSTHLYTYTRTPVPTVEGFYRQLQDRHIDLDTHCLSFLVANAASLQFGFHLLRSIRTISTEGIHAMLTLDPSGDRDSVPPPLFTAFVELLCRFSNVPLSKINNGKRWYISLRLAQTPPLLDKQPLNLQHPLAFALELLNLRRTTERPVWNLVLRALASKASLASMSFLLAQRWDVPVNETVVIRAKESRSALLAYRLVRRVLAMMQQMHVELDTTGFHYLCLSTENMAIACWKILREEGRPHPVDDAQGKWSDQKIAFTEAKQLLRSSNHVTRLKGQFRVLVGAAAEDVVGPASPTNQPTTSTADPQHPQASPDDAPALPRLLATPSPALLHAYIRALGWLADHEGLLGLVRWMVAHRAELAESCSRDRNGEAMMRKAAVAVRVFLERSWLPADVSSSQVRDGNLPDAELEEAHTSSSQPAPDDGTVLSTPVHHALRAKNLRRVERGASAAVLAEAQGLVEGVAEWGGWPSEGEVRSYVRDERFRNIRDLYDTGK